MALGTITVQVNAQTSNAYSNFANTVIQAYHYCSAKLGADISLASGTVGTNAVTTNDNEGIAVSMLTAMMLINGKEHSKPDGVPKTIDELYTTEIENMLLKPDELDESQFNKGVAWDNEPPSSVNDPWVIF